MTVDSKELRHLAHVVLLVKHVCSICVDVIDFCLHLLIREYKFIVEGSVISRKIWEILKLRFSVRIMFPQVAFIMDAEKLCRKVNAALM